MPKLPDGSDRRLTQHEKNELRRQGELAESDKSRSNQRRQDTAHHTNLVPVKWEDDVPAPDRGERVKRTKELTRTVIDRGGDNEGIGGVFGVINWFLFGKNPGKRDDLSGADQHKVMLGDELATDRIKQLPKVSKDSKTPPTKAEQKSKNEEIYGKAREGAQAAREYIDDQKENGNWLSSIFNPPTVWDEWSEREKQEQAAKAEPETRQKTIFDSDVQPKPEQEKGHWFWGK